MLINLMHVDRLSLLGGLPGYEFIVPDRLRAETTESTQGAMLDDAASSGFSTRRRDVSGVFVPHAEAVRVRARPACRSARARSGSRPDSSRPSPRGS